MLGSVQRMAEPDNCYAVHTARFSTLTATLTIDSKPWAVKVASSANSPLCCRPWSAFCKTRTSQVARGRRRPPLPKFSSLFCPCTCTWTRGGSRWDETGPEPGATELPQTDAPPACSNCCGSSVTAVSPLPWWPEHIASNTYNSLSCWIAKRSELASAAAGRLGSQRSQTDAPQAPAA